MGIAKFNSWSNQKLRESLEGLAARERRICALVVEHVAEVISRASFVDWGFPSIRDYLVLGLNYSESAAQRRISAAYVLIQIPELKIEIESGSLNLTQIVMAQAAINLEQKTNGRVSLEERRELFGELLGKSRVETQKLLDQKFETPPIFSAEKHKHDESVEVTVRMPKELYEKFSRIKDLSSHSVPDRNWVDILNLAADDCLGKRDPLLKPPQSRTAAVAQTVSQESTALAGAASTVQRKALRSSVRRYIFQRDRVCQHRNSDGTLCGSQNRLEIDHIQPKYTGGSDQIENLRVLCRTHNQARYRLGR